MKLLCNITLRDISDIYIYIYIYPAVDRRKLSLLANKYRINTENGGFKPDTGCIWLEADVRGIYLTYFIVEEVSKTIEIINSRNVSVYILEFIISIYNWRT